MKNFGLDRVPRDKTLKGFFQDDNPMHQQQIDFGNSFGLLVRDIDPLFPHYLDGVLHDDARAQLPE